MPPPKVETALAVGPEMLSPVMNQIILLPPFSPLNKSRSFLAARRGNETLPKGLDLIQAIVEVHWFFL